VKLTTEIDLALRLGMSGAIPRLPRMSSCLEQGLSFLYLYYLR